MHETYLAILEITEVSLFFNRMGKILPFSDSVLLIIILAVIAVVKVLSSIFFCRWHFFFHRGEIETKKGILARFGSFHGVILESAGQISRDITFSKATLIQISTN